MLLGNRAERVARFDCVRLGGGGRRRCGRAGSTGYLDVSDDVLLPCRNGFDRGPDLVLLGLRGDSPLEIQLAVAFLGTAVKLTLRSLNRYTVTRLSSPRSTSHCWAPQKTASILDRLR